MASIGLRTGHNSKGENVIENMLPSFPAAASGMLQVGDVIVKVDKTQCDGLGPDEVHDLLMGEVESMVRITYKRGDIEMTVTLTRETGDEHVLTEHHGNWKKADLSSQKEKEMEARRRADNIHAGQVRPVHGNVLVHSSW